MKKSTKIIIAIVIVVIVGSVIGYIIYRKKKVAEKPKQPTEELETTKSVEEAVTELATQ